MSITSPAFARQAKACGLQGLGMRPCINCTTRATRLTHSTASLRSSLIDAGWPKIGLEPLITSPC